ncbi:MAG: hypothetical protein LBN07_00385 [Christensenellaceae bacterium]|jgi:hypothetical protein|nr:hypothetical protein [Christensenellaceae bacterium]
MFTESFKKKFKEFLKYNMTDEYFNFNVYLDKLETQHGNSSMDCYELGSFYTRSKNSELFYYNTTYKFFKYGAEVSCDKVGDNDFDYCEITFDC